MRLSQVSEPLAPAKNEKALGKCPLGVLPWCAQLKMLGAALLEGRAFPSVRVRVKPVAWA